MKISDKIIDPSDPIKPIPNPIDKELIEKILQSKLGFMQYINIIGLFVTMIATYFFITKDSTHETFNENKKDNNKSISVTS